MTDGLDRERAIDADDDRHFTVSDSREGQSPQSKT